MKMKKIKKIERKIKSNKEVFDKGIENQRHYKKLVQEYILQNLIKLSRRK